MIVPYEPRIRHYHNILFDHEIFQAWYYCRTSYGSFWTRPCSNLQLNKVYCFVVACISVFVCTTSEHYFC